jgi:hypothetical protein
MTLLNILGDGPAASCSTAAWPGADWRLEHPITRLLEGRLRVQYLFRIFTRISESYIVVLRASLVNTKTRHRLYRTMTKLAAETNGD